MKDIAVLVMSCDAYEDIWGAFYKLFTKYWNCPYKVYFGTETKDNKDFTTIKTQGSWTSRVRQTLEQIDTKYVIFLLDDFFLRKQVRQDIIDSAVAQFDDHTAVFNFELNKDTKTIESSLNGFKTRQNNQMYLCSCQPSLWDREKLISLLQEDMTPWQWETQILDSEYKFNINTTELVFDIGYYEERKPWCIVQGKWATECIDLFKKENIQIDFMKRGFIDMKLSIITPYYKTLEFTKRLAQVLEPQLNREVEWIIVDDGCNEKELDTLKAKVIHQPNGGVSKARNTALKQAQGKYIAFIDSDDMVTSDYVSKIISKIDTSPFDYCFISWKDTNGREVIINNFPPQDNNSVWNCIYKRENCAKFPENITYGEETSFNIKSRIGKRENITDMLYIYTVGRPESLTDDYCTGKIGKYRPLKAQIVMFLRFVSKIGGVETFLYEFFKEFHDKYNILFLYEESDPFQLKRYKQFVRCELYENQQIECETYLNVNCSKNIADNVKATSGQYLDMVHTDYTAMGWKYTKHPKTTMTICVSKVGQKAFQLQYAKDKSEVIYNLLKIEEPIRALHLISATRLSWEKGYDRMKMLAKRLNELKKPFTWLVFTNDVPDEEIDGFVFMKPRYDVIKYVASADYYLSLSNTECCSYSNFEAFDVGVPIICTNYPSIFEQGMVDGKTGYVLNMDMSNMDEVIEKMYKKIPKFDPIKNDFSKQWVKYLGEEQKSDYVYDEKEADKTALDITDRWVCLQTVKDDTGVRKPAGSEVIIKSTERVRMLLDNNLIKRMEETK